MIKKQPKLAFGNPTDGSFPNIIVYRNGRYHYCHICGIYSKTYVKVGYEELGDGYPRFYCNADSPTYMWQDTKNKWHILDISKRGKW